MKLVFNVSNKVFYTIIAIAFVASLALVGYAYKSGGPPNKMGHSAEELEVEINGIAYTLQQAITNNLIGSPICEVLHEGETNTKVTMPSRCLDNECFLFFKVTDSGDSRFATYPTSQWGAANYFQLDTQAGTPASWSFGPGYNAASEKKSGKNGETDEIIFRLSTLLIGGDISTPTNYIYFYDDHHNEELGIKEWYIHEPMINGKTGKARVKLTAC